MDTKEKTGLTQTVIANLQEQQLESNSTSQLGIYDSSIDLISSDLSNLTFSSQTLWSNTTGAIGSGVWTTTTPNTAINTGIGQITWPKISPSPVVNSGITVAGDDADIVIRGKSLLKWMEQIEQRLNILQPNTELEREWDELRRLGDLYREMENKCKEKSQMWNKLKSMPPPQTP